MSLVTVATFQNAFNMNVLKGRLENEGIPAFAKDEHTVSVNPLYGSALGGIKLQVREEDAPEAQRILHEAGYRLPYIPPQQQQKQLHPIIRFLLFLFVFACIVGFVYLVHDPLAYMQPAKPPIVLPLPTPH